MKVSSMGSRGWQKGVWGRGSKKRRWIPGFSSSHSSDQGEEFQPGQVMKLCVLSRDSHWHVRDNHHLWEPECLSVKAHLVTLSGWMCGIWGARKRWAGPPLLKLPWHGYSGSLAWQGGQYMRQPLDTRFALSPGDRWLCAQHTRSQRDAQTSYMWKSHASGLVRERRVANVPRMADLKYKPKPILRAFKKWQLVAGFKLVILPPSRPRPAR